jgi:hypothetical protein
MAGLVPAIHASLPRGEGAALKAQRVERKQLMLHERVARFGEQRQHVISHQVDRLCDGPNIDAWFQTRDAISENGLHIEPGQNFSLNEMLEKRERGHAIGNCDALGATAKEVDHG